MREIKPGGGGVPTRGGFSFFFGEGTDCVLDAFRNAASGSCYLAVARGLLQERPLQFQHGNIRVKSWQPMSNSWSTSSQPDLVRALGRGEKKQHEIATARFCT